jgi:hypothetical protein
MEQYRGTFPDLIYIFLQYVSLSNPAVIVAMAIGAISTGLSIAMILARPLRKYRIVLFVLAAATILTGLTGSVLNMREANEAKLLEMRAGLSPSAQRYYDTEYGYNKNLFYLFPFLTGILSAIPSLFLGIFAVKTRQHKTWEERE